MAWDPRANKVNGTESRSQASLSNNDSDEENGIPRRHNNIQVSFKTFLVGHFHQLFCCGKEAKWVQISIYFPLPVLQ